jgi:hypothetical protein
MIVRRDFLAAKHRAEIAVLASTEANDPRILRLAARRGAAMIEVMIAPRRVKAWQSPKSAPNPARYEA